MCDYSNSFSLSYIDFEGCKEWKLCLLNDKGSVRYCRQAARATPTASKMNGAVVYVSHAADFMKSLLKSVL